MFWKLMTFIESLLIITIKQTLYHSGYIYCESILSLRCQQSQVETSTRFEGVDRAVCDKRHRHDVTRLPPDL